MSEVPLLCPVEIDREDAIGGGGVASESGTKVVGKREQGQLSTELCDIQQDITPAKG